MRALDLKPGVWYHIQASFSSGLDGSLLIDDLRVRQAVDPACTRCGVKDLDAPCVGDAEHGSRPLPYRHAGRPPASNQKRLDGPNLTQGGLWDTEGAPIE